MNTTMFPASLVRLAYAASAVLAVTIEPAARQEQATFRAGVQSVAIYATVRDSAGRLVPDLDRTAFQVLDNGRPANITVFSNERQPLRVAIMLDMSGSMVERVLTVRESTMRFIAALSAVDRARIGTFGAEIAISPVLTGDKDVLTRVLSEELWPGNGFTPLWRATSEAMASLDGERGRRVILLLSDGRDTDTLGSRPSPEDVKRRAVRDSVMVYAVKLEGRWGNDAHELADVTEETGGGHFELKSDADLGETFVRVAEELRHQYFVGFSPAVLDGKTHKLDVRVAHGGYKVRAARGYLAREER